jgi:hypothetical protein
MGDQVQGKADYLELGTWNARCSMCGAKFKANRLVQNWQGLRRCPACNEPRQPQDFVRGVQDIQTPAWAQVDEDIDLKVCTYNACSAIPGWGQPGCSVPGRKEIEPIYGLFGLNFTGSVGGLTSATLTQPILFAAGVYRTNFTDGEFRNATFSYLSVSWTTALQPGYIISAYVYVPR